MPAAAAVRPMTTKQSAFIESLLRDRQVSAETETLARQLLAAEGVSTGDASAVIDRLMAMPKKVRAAAPAAAGRWTDIVVPSMYAIPAETLSGGLQAKLGGNDHLFVQIKRYQGTVYMRRLHGAPGSFSRSRLEWAEVDEVCDILRGDCKTFADKFSDLYSCCGSCGAELTDPVSRAAKLGPECRRKFGL